MKLKPLLNLKEAAKLLRLSTKTVRRRTKDAGLPVTHIGAAVRFDPDALQAWLEEQTTREA